ALDPFTQEDGYRERAVKPYFDFACQHVILKEERLKNLFTKISLTSQSVIGLLTKDSSRNLS
ncbi:MAG: hypothetical protein ACC651_13185, partial [Candidatus Scalindua sp.]